MIETILQNDKLPAIKFTNILLDDCIVITEYINEGYKSVIQSTPYTRQHRKNCVLLYDILYHNYRMINAISLLFDISVFDDILVSDEIVFTFASVMNDNINRIVGTYNCDLDFIKVGCPDNESKQINMNILVFEILNMCYQAHHKNNKFGKLLVSDQINYNINNFINACEYLYEKTDMHELLITRFVEFVGELKKIEEDAMNNSEPEYDEEIPDEFLDPLTYEAIKDPILLPGMQSVNGNHDMFIERSIVLKQLLEKEENPFTRDKLTRKELEEYNEKYDSKERINDFIKRFNAWKDEHLINKN